MPCRKSFQFKHVEQDALLLVEGIEDAIFFDAFLHSLGQTNVQIASVNGKDNFRKFLIETLKRASKFQQLRRLGIVRDADTNASSTLQSLCNALTAAQLPVPSHPWETAHVNGLHVSLAILPDGTSPGNLEDLCLRSLENTSALACVDQYIACRADAGADITDSQRAKAKIYTYLAVGSKPGLRLGEAAEDDVWNWDSPAFARVAKFLHQLSSPPDQPK